MNKETIKKAISIISMLLQIMIIGAVFVINDLTDKKAGVMHHVYYKRSQYERGIYSPENLSWQVIVLAFLAVIFAAVFIHAVKNKRGVYYKIQSALGVGIGLSAIFVIKSSIFMELLAYPYFIMAFEIAMGIQILVFTVTGLLERNRL